jgi:hypothetical protein
MRDLLSKTLANGSIFEIACAKVEALVLRRFGRSFHEIAKSLSARHSGEYICQYEFGRNRWALCVSRVMNNGVRAHILWDR